MFMNTQKFTKKTTRSERDPIYNLERELNIRGFSQKTIKSYLYYNKELLKCNRKSPKNINIDDIKEYLLYLKKRKLSNSTLNSAISALKFYFLLIIKGKAEVAPLHFIKSQNDMLDVPSKINIKPFLEISFFIFPLQSFIFIYALTEGPNLTFFGSEKLILAINFLVLSVINWRYGQVGVPKQFLFLPAIGFFSYMLFLETNGMSLEIIFIALLSVSLAFLFTLFFNFSAWLPFLSYAVYHKAIHHKDIRFTWDANKK